MAFQFRRGTDAERQSITPKAGEPLFVTDTGKVFVGNGTTQGGLLVSAAVSDDDSPSLGGNLDLNNNNIIGAGNINIDGTITATGSINLGDGVEDNIIVGGVIGSNLIPDTDGIYDLGSNDFYWRKGYFEDVAVDGELSANSLQVNSIELDDSTTIFDGLTNSLFVGSIVANNIESNFQGSVFADDSTLLVDALDSSLNTTFLKIRDTEIAVQNESQGLNLITNQGIGVRANNISGDPSSNLLILESAKTVNNSLASPSPGDSIGGFGASIYSDSIDTYEAKSLIVTRLDTSGEGSNLDFAVADSTGELQPTFILNSQGVAECNIFKTGSYTNETERDTAIPNPEQGMIIFLSGHDDSSGFPKFQGYDGTAWRDFN